MPAAAHGIAGNRFFPATIATDDPAVADELSLPTLASFKTADDPAATETDVSAEYSKRITSRLGVSFADTWTELATAGRPSHSGFQTLETTVKYQLLTSASHEAIVSLGVSIDWGGTGARGIGADAVSAVTPTLYFGKGAGDLPQALSWARPFAITGVIGLQTPTLAHETLAATDPITGAPVTTIQSTTRVLQTGLALEYSLAYLSAHVRDLGFPALINQITPLVELSFSSPVANEHGAGTTGTISPGLIWSGRHFQVGAEAMIPANKASGRAVGGVVQLPFFLDDLFPRSIGKPVL